ncbi:MAG: hypothetical protein ACLPX1_02755 [Steroidobacteraceae bacterium]
MGKKIQVALDTTANPQVVVIPYIAVVKSGDKIRWTLIANEDFKFAILTPEKKFIHDIQYSATEITATYDAPPNSAVNYVITVHDTNGNPHSTAAHSAAPGGGGPTIKNN